MAENAIVDAGFIVALLSSRDEHHQWAASQARQILPPWRTCDAALSEAFHLLGVLGQPALAELLSRAAVRPAFVLADNLDSVMALMQKYASVPMSLADASLVRMTEILSGPVVLTTDGDFRVYRRHGRQVIPCFLPS